MHLDKIFTKEYLEQEYSIKKRTKFDLSREHNCSVHSINKYCKKFNIPNNKIVKLRINLKGQKIHRWKIVERGPDLVLPSGNKQVRWFCVCDCGNKKLVANSSLHSGASKSCGCFKHEKYNKGYKDISGAYWHKIEKAARERQYKFEITLEQAWDKFCEQKGKCALSGIELRLHGNNDKAFLQTASLDRIDSSKDYTIDNVQWVHKIVNFMKSALPDNDFIWWCRQIAMYNQNISLNDPITMEYVPQRKQSYEINK